MNKHIKTELPGPLARALLERDRAVVSPSYPRDYPFVMDHGKGAEVWDIDGNRFIDFAAGIAVCSTGHSHPQVVQAIQQAAERFLHISSDYWHEGQVQLAETLNRLAPFDEPAMSFFCNSGTESVEGALKLARYVTGRPRFIGFLGGFHGRSMGSLSFTSSKYTQQSGFFPTMPGVTLVPYPNAYRPLFAGEDQGRAVLSYIEDTLFQSSVPAKEVAAVLIEPIQGEGGYLVPPPGFLKGLRELCSRHGILLIFDEVQSAVGRTGRMFASEHVSVVPDIITMAKGLGSGMPIGMVLAKRQIMQQWKRGAHGNTYGGNPVCCAAASATLKLVEEKYSANAAEQGAYIMERLRAMQNKYPDLIGQVRGMGLMIGIELVTDCHSRKPATDFTNRLLDVAFRNGLLLLSCGSSTLRLMPPLMIDRPITDEALQLLDASIAQTLSETQEPTGS
jgi:4-aminobutyrate aminotransferase